MGLGAGCTLWRIAIQFLAGGAALGGTALPRPTLGGDDGGHGGGAAAAPRLGDEDEPRELPLPPDLQHRAAQPWQLISETM